MKKSIEVIINGKTFKLGYGMEVFVNLGTIWGFDTLEEVNEQFQILTTMGGDSPTPLKNIILISQIIEAMISGNPENKEKISAAEIRAVSMMEFQQLAVQLTEGFVSNMPQEEPEDFEDGKKLKPKGKK